MTTTQTRQLQVTVNGRTRATTAETLAALVQEQGFAGSKVATAVNGDFVPERRRAATKIGQDDRVEILTVRQGG